VYNKNAKINQYCFDFIHLIHILNNALCRQSSSADWWSGIFGFLAWACLPYGILLFLNIIQPGKIRKDIALLVTTAIVSGFGIILIIDAFFIHIDAQGGLVFLFIPMYQSIAAIAGGLIGLVFYVRS